MARLEWARLARETLDRMVVIHSLPADTRRRVERSLQHLARFPRLGRQIEGRDELRLVLGPWRWMILGYVFFEEEDRVIVVAVEDARSSSGSKRVAE